MPRKKFTVEQAFLDLDEIVEKLEKDDTSLKDALSLYSQGMKLVKKCQDSLDMVEKELMILEEDKAPSSVKDEA